MDLTGKCEDEGAISEIIGALLLVGLVVVGGAVVGAMYFSQPTPKGVPHLSFYVDWKDNNATLYHTGGDTLVKGEYRVYIDDVDVTDRVDLQSWSYGEPLPIRDVTRTPGTVLLTYKDTGDGETLLRKVVFSEDGRPGQEPIRGTLMGFVYWDANDDGMFTVGEIKLGNTLVNLTSPSGALLQQVPTDPLGDYSFTGLSAGTYLIGLEPREDWIQLQYRVSPPYYTKTIETDGQVIDNLNFGVVPGPEPETSLAPGDGYICGFKFNDTDNDHEWDADESGLGGWRIRAEFQGEDLSWTEAGNATTDGSGFYNITGLSEGHYRVSEMIAAGSEWNQTYPVDDGGSYVFNLNGLHLNMSGQNFGNHHGSSSLVVPTVTPWIDLMGNHVVELEKRSTDKGYLVGGTWYECEAKKGSYVTIDGRNHPLQNNDRVRLEIYEDQYDGRVVSDHLAISEFSFRVNLYINGGRVDTGMCTAISIESVNKNKELTTLTYRLDSDSSWTHLDIDGKPVIPDVVDARAMTVSSIHLIHSNKFGEGLNLDTIDLNGSKDIILAQCEIRVY